jgi:nifR3 family TIM-barrel protein
LIEAVVNAVDIPVTLKTRLGWDDDSLNAPDVARRAQDAGIALVTIHGRTRCQFYKGNADWGAIRRVRDAVTIPVIANGDITDSATARAAMDQSGADGVMIGRGAQGRPWVLAQICSDLYGTPAPDVPTGKALCDMVSNHYEAMLMFYGSELGSRVARKHLGWYMDVAHTPRELRGAVLTLTDPAKVLTLLPDALIQPAQVAA